MMDRTFQPFPVLKTERLTLRQLINSDAEAIFALRSDGNVNKYLDRKQSQSIDDAIDFIQIINENVRKNHSIYWAITLNDTNNLIGTICLFNFSNNNLKAEIGFELLPSFQGKGLMREAVLQATIFAFEHIGVHSIKAYTHCNNQASIRLLETLHFKRHSVVSDNLILFTITSSFEIDAARN